MTMYQSILNIAKAASSIKKLTKRDREENLAGLTEISEMYDVDVTEPTLRFFQASEDIIATCVYLLEKVGVSHFRDIDENQKLKAFTRNLREVLEEGNGEKV